MPLLLGAILIELFTNFKCRFLKIILHNLNCIAIRAQVSLALFGAKDWFVELCAAAREWNEPTDLGILINRLTEFRDSCLTILKSFEVLARAFKCKLCWRTNFGLERNQFFFHQKHIFPQTAGNLRNHFLIHPLHSFYELLHQKLNSAYACHAAVECWPIDREVATLYLEPSNSYKLNSNS